MKLLSNLSMDEKEDLEALTLQPGFPALMKEIQTALSCIEQDLIREPLDIGNPMRVALVKARVEGAQKLVASIRMRLARRKEKDRRKPSKPTA